MLSIDPCLLDIVELNDTNPLRNDRTHVLIDIPDWITSDAEMVQLSNSDKDSASINHLITVDDPAALYIGIDNRQFGNPGGQDIQERFYSWMTDAEFTGLPGPFFTTEQIIGVDENNNGSANQYFTLFQTLVDSGQYNFGAHEGGGNNMYIVFADVIGGFEGIDPLVPPEPVDPIAGNFISTVTKANGNASCGVGGCPNLDIVPFFDTDGAPNLLRNDRTHVLTDIPQIFSENVEMVQFSNSDKDSGQIVHELTLKNDAILYLGIDNRQFDNGGGMNIQTSEYSWMSDFAFTGFPDDFVNVSQIIGVDEDNSGDANQYFTLFAVDAPAGTYSIGAHEDGGNNMYVVFADGELQAGPICDLNNDGNCGLADIDALMQEVAAGTNNSQFDLTSDGLVNDDDRDQWLVDAGPQNGFAGPFLVGDSNLDGQINASDLNALGLSWLTDVQDWSKGNFTGSGVNAADLNAMALNWQQSVPVASPVPEPSSVLLGLMSLLGLFAVRRQR